MYRKKETEFQYAPGIVSILEDVTGGGTVARENIKGIINELPPCVVVGKDDNGLFHVVKTATVIGGTTSAPRIEKNHLLKVGETISDGVAAAKIASITPGEEYDTLAFADGGSLTLTDGVVHQTKGVNKASSVILEGGEGHLLTLTAPVGEDVENFNGIEVELVKAGGDALAVTYADGKITISLAKTTASKNNDNHIQTAIRALTVEGLDFTKVTAVGGDGWNGAQTGDTLTDPTGSFAGGVYAGAPSEYKYSPVAITMNKVDLTVANQPSGLLARGTVNESVMPYPIDDALKAALPHIRFV